MPANVPFSDIPNMALNAGASLHSINFPNEYYYYLAELHLANRKLSLA